MLLSSVAARPGTFDQSHVLGGVTNRWLVCSPYHCHFCNKVIFVWEWQLYIYAGP